MRRSGRPRGARPCGSSRGRRGSPGMRLSDWAPDCASVGDSTVVLSNCAWSPGHDANHTPRIVGFEEPTSCFLVEGSLDETTAAGKGMEAAPVTEASRQPDPECASAELLRNRKNRTGLTMHLLQLSARFVSACMHGRGHASASACSAATRSSQAPRLAWCRGPCVRTVAGICIAFRTFLKKDG